ncbi:hypothetical protein LUZ61_016539 [Rhynchospora tenuis]|uniref:WRKY domain-containing protein n=1 Tax=Rhynchospora tenuis TaxID=198213 RepID=A0AAD6EK46_9POAL|nr:hypothetical protein LUZ61_016539 [Rhynchospora tenuis]
MMRNREEGDGQHKDEVVNSNARLQLVMPEDDYDWKKYGQKYIRNIQKIRSYFKCKNKSCNAKKRVEWHPSNPSNLRIVYDGNHDHHSKLDLDQGSSSGSANQYDLSNQIFGQVDGTPQ